MEAYVRGLERLREAAATCDGAARSRRSSSRASTPRPTSGSRASDDRSQGKLAIANAKLAYQNYKRVSRRALGALAAKGATPQRCLWASTSTKNPDYRDVMYVEELIGRDT
jgi:transaldolase